MSLETANITVEGMTCANCARTIERKLTAKSGVTKAKVELSANLATVAFDADRTSLPDLVSTIEQLGYRVRP